MKLHELRPPKGSHRPRKRVGRGIAAGQGKTAGRGQKGQFSRSSVGLPRAFEGGQMPLSQRLPKLRGFHNRFKKEYAVVNLGKLNRFEPNSVVDAEVLREVGLARRSRHGIKVLAAGKLRVPLILRVHRISAAARAAVEAAGGRVELLDAPAEVETAASEAAASGVAASEAAAGEAAAGEAVVAEPTEAAAAPAEPRRRQARRSATAAAESVSAEAEEQAPQGDEPTSTRSESADEG
jgi:large subunit ribosomal protein L15